MITPSNCTLKKNLVLDVGKTFSMNGFFIFVMNPNYIAIFHYDMG